MKRFAYAAGLVFAALVALPALAQWSRGELDGRQACVRSSGETFTPSYESKSWVTAACNVLNQVEQWLGGTRAPGRARWTDTGAADDDSAKAVAIEANMVDG